MRVGTGGGRLERSRLVGLLNMFPFNIRLGVGGGAVVDKSPLSKPPLIVCAGGLGVRNSGRLSGAGCSAPRPRPNALGGGILPLAVYQLIPLCLKPDPLALFFSVCPNVGGAIGGPSAFCAGIAG